MAKLWLGKVRALFHFILSLRIDMKKRVYQNFDTPSCGNLWAFSPLLPTNITQWQRIGFTQRILTLFYFCPMALPWAKKPLSMAFATGAVAML